jgi:tocopherol cyclase
MSLRATLTPGMYHGFDKKPPFFEGWYYKLVSADENYKVAIIPGVILGQDAHSFVQVLDGVDGSTAYHIFPFEDFRANDRSFALSIGENRFDGSYLELALERPEGQLTGHIQLGSLNPWPVTWLSPGVMGWYAWVPRMECYHGVLSFDHPLQGTLKLNGKMMDFSGGHGYMEKDWGQAFPAAWIWFQSNHFSGVSACITGSVAIIPWVGQAFRGFIVGLWLDGELYRFTTYNRSRIESLQIFDDHVDWVMVNNKHRLSLTACRVQGGLLRGPTRLDMGKRVLETLNATVQVRLETIHGGQVFEGVGAHTGLEVMGDLPRLLQG